MNIPHHLINGSLVINIIFLVPFHDIFFSGSIVTLIYIYIYIGKWYWYLIGVLNNTNLHPTQSISKPRT